MDVAGAKELRRRLEQQQHWRQAEAVRDGRQPRRDPDADELTGLAEGVRFYGVKQVATVVNGQPRVVAHTLCKRLTDGRWESGHVVELVRSVGWMT